MVGDSIIVELGEVVYVEGDGSVEYPDSANACRIKVRMDSDKVDDKDLPYAFPLLPKTFQSVPKIGEGVFVFNARLGKTNSQRYYIGPIISQPQYQEKCLYNSGEGDAVSLISGGKTLKNTPLTALSRAGETVHGSFPEPNDVAMVGRGQEDMVLKYRANNEYGSETSEVDLRAGIRLKPGDSTKKYVQGNVVFNRETPGYIQIKHATNGIAGLNDGVGDEMPTKYESREIREANSVINVVADKINLISHKDSHKFGEKITNSDQLVLEREMDNIMSQMHRAVYGDELINLLKLMARAICEHTHPCSMLPPTIKGTVLEELRNGDKYVYNYEGILSPNVRIS